eukprot:3791710-Pyramimonas_sp.AAC.1
MSSAGFDLDAEDLPRAPSCAIMRPPSDGLGCLARAKNIRKGSRIGRWLDIDPIDWGCESRKTSYGSNVAGHLKTP